MRCRFPLRIGKKSIKKKKVLQADELKRFRRNVRVNIVTKIELVVSLVSLEASGYKRLAVSLLPSYIYTIYCIYSVLQCIRGITQAASVLCWAKEMPLSICHLALALQLLPAVSSCVARSNGR